MDYPFPSTPQAPAKTAGGSGNQFATTLDEVLVLRSQVSHMRASLEFIVSQEQHRYISPEALLIQCIDSARRTLEKC